MSAADASIERVHSDEKDPPKNNEALTSSLEEAKEDKADQGDIDIHVEEQNLNDDGTVEQSDEERPTAK